MLPSILKCWEVQYLCSFVRFLWSQSCMCRCSCVWCCGSRHLCGKGRGMEGCTCLSGYIERQEWGNYSLWGPFLFSKQHSVNPACKNHACATDHAQSTCIPVFPRTQCYEDTLHRWTGQAWTVNGTPPLGNRVCLDTRHQCYRRTFHWSPSDTCSPPPGRKRNEQKGTERLQNCFHQFRKDTSCPTLWSEYNPKIPFPLLPKSPNTVIVIIRYNDPLRNENQPWDEHLIIHKY